MDNEFYAFHKFVGGGDSSVLNVPPVSLSNVPGRAGTNVPPTVLSNVPSAGEEQKPVVAGMQKGCFEFVPVVANNYFGAGEKSVRFRF